MATSQLSKGIVSGPPANDTGAPGGGGGDAAATVRAALRWTKVYWLLAAVLLAGLLLFPDAIRDSIASTPHPALVYAIFVVAAAAAILFGQILGAVVREHGWIDRLLASDAAERASLIADKPNDDALTPVYRLFLQTSYLPVAERKQALDHEVDTAENLLIGRMALPNLLSGSLVGLGLVGTFIGLLGTLHDLSGVFAALGGGAGGNAAEMFSTMIQKLKGPMQGMGTAFVASLYGLLGSLVIGVVGVGVRRQNDTLFARLRLFVSDELYEAVGADQPLSSDGTKDLSGSVRALIAATREEHGALRASMDEWTRRLDERIGEISRVTSALAANLQNAVDSTAASARESVASLDKSRHESERLVSGLDATTSALVGRLDAMRDAVGTPPKRAYAGSATVAGGLSLLAIGGVAGLGLSIRHAPPPEVPVRAETTIPARPSAAPAEAPAASAVASGPAQPIAAAAPVPTPVASPEPIAGDSVEVQRGDSLSEIAARKGVSLQRLIAANPQIKNPNRLLIGQRVDLPKK